MIPWEISGPRLLSQERAKRTSNRDPSSGRNLSVEIDRRRIQQEERSIDAKTISAVPQGVLQLLYKTNDSACQQKTTVLIAFSQTTTLWRLTGP